MKKKLLISAIVFVLIGVAVTVSVFSEPVKVFFNETISNIFKPTEKIPNLEKVTNFNFDEEALLLSFDGVEGSVGYFISISNNLTQNKYNTTETEITVELPDKTLTGDTIRFYITALGDNKTAYDSEKAVFAYVVKYQTEIRYLHLEEDMMNYFNGVINSQDKMHGVSIQKFITIEIKNNYIYYKGLAIDEYDKELVFTMEFDASLIEKYLREDFDNFNEFEMLIFATGDISLRFDLEYSFYFTSDYTDLSTGLFNSNSLTIQNYLSNGYTVKTLSQTHSDVYELNSYSNAFTIKGIYEFSNETTGDIITMQLEHEVQMVKNDNDITTDAYYYNHYNETSDYDTFDVSAKDFDTNLMKHINIINKITEKK